MKKKNRKIFFFGGARNSHLARLQDFWNLKGNQSPARKLKWSQKAREYHLEAGDGGKGEGVEGMGPCQNAPQVPHGPQRIHNSC